jgi:hypothetical protein
MQEQHWNHWWVRKDCIYKLLEEMTGKHAWPLGKFIANNCVKCSYIYIYILYMLGASDRIALGSDQSRVSTLTM